MEGKLNTQNLLNLDKTIAKELLINAKYPWDILTEIKNFIVGLGESLPESDYDKIGDDIWVAKDAQIAKSAFLTGPLIIDSMADVRHCAFIRGSAIIGKNTVVGNSTEIKNVILFDEVQVPHYNYVGDSILGYKSHMGAGAITSNVKSDRGLIKIISVDGSIHTNLKKFGAVLGDYVEIGCNAVLNPGTVVGKNSTVYPLSMVRDFVPENSIHKNNGDIISKRL